MPAQARDEAGVEGAGGLVAMGRDRRTARTSSTSRSRSRGSRAASPASTGRLVGPRLGARAARRRGGVARPAGGPGLTVSGHTNVAVASPPSLERAVDAYLTFLSVERGLAVATIRAYRGDLADFADARGTGREWASGPDAGTRATSPRAPGAAAGHDPGLAPTSLRRRAAAHQGLLPVRVRRGPDRRRRGRAPRPAAHAAPPARDADRGGDRAPAGAPRPEALLDRALLELLYAAGLRVSEALRLDLEDISLDGAFVRVIGKGDRERLVPVGEVALDAIRAWLDGPRAAIVGRAPRRSPCAAGRCS